VYGKLIAQSVDPIEKKPLFHFLPGSKSYSIATVGCNFRCLNCQNSDISQVPRERGVIIGQNVSPIDVVIAAKRSNCQSIAYTYSEPTIFFEYAFDVAKLAHREGIKNVFVTNGYITEEALSEIGPYLHGANIDLKSFSDQFYQKTCRARLSPVLEAIQLYKELGIWIEITTLIIPTLNDSKDNLQSIAEYIVNLDPWIPWHISRFHPMYELTHISATPIATLHQAHQIGLNAGLKYVYEGNAPGQGGETTYCDTCKKELIGRRGFRILVTNIHHGNCLNCGSRVHGIFNAIESTNIT
jgi:pyruvate formate lyase activating enzyme